jgi:hypothetical protein
MEGQPQTMADSIGSLHARRQWVYYSEAFSQRRTGEGKNVLLSELCERYPSSGERLSGGMNRE